MCCRVAGFRHADDDVRIHGGIFREETAGKQTCGIHVDAVNAAVRAGEINVLKNAASLLFGGKAVRFVGENAVRRDGDNLARLYVADEFRAHGVKRTGLAGEEIRVVALADT